MKYHRTAGLWSVAASLLAFSGLASAYNPPIGVPDPSWGSIHPVDTQAPPKPSAWPQQVASNAFYVDATHSKATDYNNPNGTPYKPRRTVPDRVFGPGSYIEIHGEYSERVTKRYQLEFQCTEAQPCWLRGEKGDEPNFKKFLSLKNSKYVFIENLNFIGGSGTAFWAEAEKGKSTHHIVFRNSLVKDRQYSGSNTAGASFAPEDGGKVHDVVMYNNRFINLGKNVDWNVDYDFHGMTPNVFGLSATSGAELRNVWLLDNYCSGVSGNCVQVVGQNCRDGDCLGMLHHLYIGRNTAHSNRQAGFWSKQANHVIFSQNTSYDNRSYGSQPGDGMGFQYDPDNIWFIYNRIYDSNYGIRQSHTSSAGKGRKAYFVGNLIYDIHPQPGAQSNINDDWREGVGISLWRGVMDRYIYHNTINNVNAGIVAIHAGPLDIKGNVIGDIANNDYHVSVRDTSATLDYGLMHDPSVGMRVRWNFKEYTSVNGLHGTVSQCRRCIDESPQFEDASANRLALKSTSPGVSTMDSRGADIYGDYHRRYGLNIRVDRNNVQRGMTMDLGAYEYVKPSTISPPTAPAGFTVNTVKR